jgi:hypothetical protein
MATTTNTEVDVRFRQLKVIEKRIRHVCIVVLSRMDYSGDAPGLLRELMIERRDLHEVGSCCRNQVDG